MLFTRPDSFQPRCPLRLWPPAFSLLGLVLALVPPAANAAVEGKITEPQLLSVFPSLGRQGTKVRAEIRGNLIAGASSVWFEDQGLSGQVLEVEEIREQDHAPSDAPPDEKREKPLLVYRVSIDVQIGPTSATGNHALRLVGPFGLSSALPFRVVDEPVILEAAEPHPSAKGAQPVSLPALINGRLDKPGQLDFYSFEAKEGQEVSIEAVPSEKVDIHLAVYRPGGSWFDPDRPTRILFEEQQSSDVMPVQARGTLRAPRDGRYFVEVSSIYGKGSPDITYRLRIALKGGVASDDERIAAGWEERSFQRKLDSDRIKTLEARSVPLPEHVAAQPSASASGQTNESAPLAAPESKRPAGRVPIASIAEREPNDLLAQAMPISIPAIIEGVIERPGDIDGFKFKVDPGQKLAFEIETPELTPPRFNPRLGVVDSKDNELFSNVHRRVSLFNNNSDRQPYLKGIEPKAVYTFEQGGEYVLQVRDITSRYGGPEYRYRIFVRPQVSHVGEVQVQQGERINLVRGQSRKLIVMTSHEEGFAGDVTFSFAGLPEGVAAFPAAEVNDKRAPTDVDENADAVAAKIQTIAIVLMADRKAPLTDTPKTVELLCRPVAEGQPGPILPVRKIPLMVVAATPER